MILEIKILGKQTESTDTSITNRIQEMEVRILGIENMIEEIDTTVIESPAELAHDIQWSKKMLNLKCSCCGLKKMAPKGRGTIRRCGFVGEGMVLLEAVGFEVSYMLKSCPVSQTNPVASE